MPSTGVRCEFWQRVSARRGAAGLHSWPDFVPARVQRPSLHHPLPADVCGISLWLGHDQQGPGIGHYGHDRQDGLYHGRYGDRCYDHGDGHRGHSAHGRRGRWCSDAGRAAHGIFPGFVTMGLFGIVYLMLKKKMNPLLIMLVILLVSIAGAFFGVLGVQ